MLAAAFADALDDLRAHAPPGVEVRELGDAPPEEIEFVVPSWRRLPDLEAMPALRVVQVLAAGTDWIEDRLPDGVTLCNARGARDVAVAEWVVAALLGASSGLLQRAREHHEHAWRRFTPGELAGQTVLVLGLGSIGQAVRRRLEALRAEVIGVAHEARPGVFAATELPTLLPRADAVVILTPLTDATRGMVDAGFLGALPDGALVVNAARGQIVDTGALLGELQPGRLRAVLDVTDPEPLPPDHPLWDAPGLLALTPHLAGDSDAADRRAIRFAGEQLGRYARGEPLRNVVRSA
jgi:phosphoglycerate dehydrogenase-like enzyme